MPRKGEKKKRRDKSGRGNAVQVPEQVGVEHAKEAHEDNRAWDEKEDDEDLEWLGCSEDAEGSSKVRKKKRDGQRNDLESSSEGIDYPLDVWFLISEKILPEDVGRFAAICQATYYVVSTARFWFNLYKRYYSLAANLPECLTYHYMDNIRGLKQGVIRSLFYTYSPFSARVVKEEPLSGHPDKLIGAECVSQWRTKVGSFHKYFFMFVKHVKRKQRNHYTQNQPEISMDSLVHINPDEGCYILETVSSAICHIPMVMGNHLHNGHLGLSAGLCAHRLQLTLGPAYLIPKSNSGMHHRFLPTTEMFQIILEPVRDVRIFPWWHPRYKKCLPKVDVDSDCFF